MKCSQAQEGRLVLLKIKMKIKHLIEKHNDCQRKLELIDNWFKLKGLPHLTLSKKEIVNNTYKCYCKHLRRQESNWEFLKGEIKKENRHKIIIT